MITEMTDRLGTRRDRYAGLVPVLAIAFPLAAIAAGTWLPPWAFMWLLAWSVFFACKLVTWHEVAAVSHVTPGRTLAYLFAWPGMDATFFKDTPATVGMPVSRGAIRSSRSRIAPRLGRPHRDGAPAALRTLRPARVVLAAARD